MRKFFSFALIAMMAANAWAIPAKRITRTITLEGGTTVQVTLTGDENNHYWQAADGTRYVQNTDGTYEAMSLWENEVRAQRAKSRLASGNEQRQARLLKRRQAGALTGNKKGLVILVNFTDKKFTFSQNDMNDAFNKKGYTNNIAGYGVFGNGSVKDYFYSQSYGKLSIDFDVVGPVTVSKTMATYGKDVGGEGNDADAAGMVVEAINLVDSQVNFNDYDWDGDGEVDQVYVIYAGYGQAQGAAANTIWPHEWDLESAGKGKIIKDGVTIKIYACSNELMGSGQNDDYDLKDENGRPILDGIGTACHEFSHCLGFPDLYDTEGTNYGMGYWDLMCAGSYNDAGYVPAAYSSYERWTAGWMEPIELTDFTRVNALPALTDKGEAYIIYNKANKNEFYLLENRQQKDWDAGLESSGMLVLHVDYDENVWFNNTVNNTANHQRMTIIPADGICSEESEAGDTWPQNGKTELTNTSSPKASLYNANSDGKKLLNFPIRNIKQNADGTISFTAGELNIEAPVATEATNISTTGFTANWQAVENATGYRVVATGLGAGTIKETILNEDFKKLTSTNGKDGSTDYADKLDDYTNTLGWTGEKVFTGIYGAKVGNKNGGSLTTPRLTATGKATVTITAQAYGNDGGNLTIYANDMEIGKITLSSTATTQNFEVEATGSVQFKMVPTKRCYISGVRVEIGGGTTVEQTTTETSAAFTGLDSNLQWSYVVYTLMGSEQSKASNTILVDLTNGIQAVNPATNTQNLIYDINGRRVQKATKGIYIMNGKKVVIK